MAIQTIYTQVDNAKIEQCKKGKPVPPIQVPLLRNNYLGEYRTQVERDKVLKNLGILGVTDKYTYPSQDEVTNFSDITSIQQALDYCIRLIQSYEQSDANIKQLLKDVQAIQTELTSLNTDIETNTGDIKDINTKIENINNQITSINNTISEFDQKLQDLNVDDKITNRLHQHIDPSTTIKFEEDVIEVKNSAEEKNAIEVKEDGLFVVDNSEKIESNTLAITQLQTDIKITDKYTTTVEGSSPYTVGGISEGTTAESLNGKSISSILDMMLFPTVVRDLIYPSLSLYISNSLVEVGSSVIKPTEYYNQGDAGEQVNKTETLTYQGSAYSNTTYQSIGTYIFTTIIEYSAGEYLVDNKGQTTDQRVEAGSVQASESITVTYPWYAGNTTGVYKQDLIPFNQNSGTLDVSLSGQAIIKLPGSNSQLLTFKVDGGLGYLDVDLNGWTEGTETINGFPYKTWKKNDEYASVLPHQIQFKLVQ